MITVLNYWAVWLQAIGLVGPKLGHTSLVTQWVTLATTDTDRQRRLNAMRLVFQEPMRIWEEIIPRANALLALEP